MITRREMLTACAASVPSAALLPEDPPAPRREKLGVVAYAYWLHMSRKGPNTPNLKDPIAFLEFCRGRGAGGVQVNLGALPAAAAARVRDKLGEWGMYVEGIINLPRAADDLKRFESEVRTAKEAGVRVLRSVLHGGRRYEVFDTADAFDQWLMQARAALRLAEPVAARHEVRLAIENHKDLRVQELLPVLQEINSHYVGVCLDFGNNLALLEDPSEVIEALAGRAISTHVKDVAVAEYADGFLLAEVPLGQGILDLPGLVDLLRRANPEIHFNLEMLTRDPLQIPCLTPKYWRTSAKLPGSYLARTLTMVRQKSSKQPLVRVSPLAPEQQLALEDENVRRSLVYARDHLRL